MSLLKLRTGWTADAIATARAIHDRYESPAVFRDDVAIDLLSPVGRFLCRSKLAYNLFLNPVFRQMRPAIFHSFACQRYTEERLALSAAGQTNQYVILGAGLDSFALRRRDLTAMLRIFEVDHPESQEVKRRRIARSPHAPPENLELVPVDFERETVLDGLKRSSFDPGQPAFCSWLGTVVYLTPEAVFGTLDAIASLAPDSELVFNYSAANASLSDDEKEMMSSLEEKLRLAHADAMRCEFEPDHLARRVSELGFEIVAHLTSKELDEQYLEGWKGLRTLPTYRLIHLRLRG